MAETKTATFVRTPVFHALLAWIVAFVILVVLGLEGEELFLMYWAPLPVFVAFAPLLMHQIFGERGASPFLPTVLFALLLELGWFPFCPLVQLLFSGRGEMHHALFGLVLTNLIAVLVYLASRVRQPASEAVPPASPRSGAGPSAWR